MLINHDVDAQHDEEEGKFENNDVDNYDNDYYDDNKVEFDAAALALIQTIMMMVMMKITTKRS